ncbi:MAG: asparagine synthase (glutamine-hydrolyzing) [Oscillospiraceae bacterium]|nr:asparagine synthase (glutamine-hydrolyzing) [Oscillospiraceae bacterium]
MCGIAGEINQDINYILNNQDIYINMQSVLKRRGPDQDGIYIKDNAALIHTRLAVVDIENGRQPMIFTRGSEEYVLVYNGELYNTAELRHELELLGHKFTGHSDTEVVGHAYVEWKCEAVEKFNGIFAFAIWESHSGRLFMARDRIGVKPFFYAETGGGIIFASEIKALLGHSAVKSDIDANSIAEIMLIGPGRTPGYGVFRQIKELEPASYAVYRLSNPHRLCQCRYWGLTDKEHTDSFEQTVEKVRELVLDSIERQLVSDVPVCTFLSGGLDSSLISSVADRYFQKKGLKLHTFSVDYKDNEKYFTAGKFQPNSDSEYIERMKKYLSAEHHQIILDTDRLVNALYLAVDARDLPGMADVDSSLLCLCEDIKKHATVALSGECADEIFGGYPWYRDKEIRDKYGFPWSQSTEFRKSFLNSDILGYINPEDYVSERYKNTVNDTDVLYTVNKDEKRMKEMINLNMKWFMQTLLDIKDLKVNKSYIV